MVKGWTCDGAEDVNFESCTSNLLNNFKQPSAHIHDASHRREGFRLLWMVKKAIQPAEVVSGGADFDVYKVDRNSMNRNDMGDGFCDGAECRYSYVTAKSEYQQKYSSHITCQPHQSGTTFNQTGSLSIRKNDGHEWLAYKTWRNSSTPKGQNP